MTVSMVGPVKLSSPIVLLPGTTANAVQGPMQKAPSAGCEGIPEQTFGRLGPDSSKTAESPILEGIQW
jgi:hypothetical protein